MDHYEANEKKALNGGTLPVPMTWIDGGGQLPYSHVVVDVSGSMSAPTFTPNWSGPQQISRAEYVMFLLKEMYDSGAIKGDTRIYPMTPANPNWESFISANFLFGPVTHPMNPATKVWPILFQPRAVVAPLRYMSKLPHTKTLFITDEPSTSNWNIKGGTLSRTKTHGWRGDIIAW